jgi:hypothetical protein
MKKSYGISLDVSLFSSTEIEPRFASNIWNEQNAHDTTWLVQLASADEGYLCNPDTALILFQQQYDFAEAEAPQKNTWAETPQCSGICILH